LSEHNEKNSPENSLKLPRNSQNTEMIPLSYDVNVRVYAKSKLIQLRSNIVVNMVIKRSSMVIIVITEWNHFGIFRVSL